MTALTRRFGIGLAASCLTLAAAGSISLVGGSAEASAAPASPSSSSSAAPCVPQPVALPLSVKPGKPVRVGGDMRIVVKVSVDASDKTAGITMDEGNRVVDTDTLPLTNGRGTAGLTYPAHKAGRHILTVVMTADYTDTDSCTGKTVTSTSAEEQFAIKVLPKKK